MRSMQLEKEKERLISPGTGGDYEDYGVIQQTQSFTMPPPIGSGIGLGYPGSDSGGPTSPSRTFAAGQMNSFQYSSSIQNQVPGVPPLPSQYLSVQRPPQSIQTPQLRVSTPPSGPQNNTSLDGMLQEQYSRSFSPPSHVSASPPIQPPNNLSSKSTTELDLNDPSTLEIYSRILVFKEDRMRDELAFSRSLTPKQRRVVHLVAQKLGVYHYSVGEGDERYAVVTRIERENRVSVLWLQRISPLLVPVLVLATGSATSDSHVVEGPINLFEPINYGVPYEDFSLCSSQGEEVNARLGLPPCPDSASHSPFFEWEHKRRIFGDHFQPRSSGEQ